MDARGVLKQYFGYDSYKPGQESIIESILAGQDVLGIMPTGAGKSVCYQVPALLLPGITVVISPLISLMQDQVKALNEAGIHAGYINSSLTEGQITKVYELASLGTYKILYVAPERLETDAFYLFSQRVDISMVTVDEAHCISQWGQDFRPSYLNITDFIRNLSKRPVISAFTATATEEVKTDIVCVLSLNEPNVVVTGFNRENLYFSVETMKQKDAFVVDYIDKHPNDSGIIYCATRKNVDELYELLRGKGVPAAKYHAGMGNEERKRHQNDFIYDRLPVIVATNAFGMGIDKSNVRYVIHYNMPQSMENYYQEAGRAGRDGESAQCILLFAPKDVRIDQFLLEHKEFKDVPPEDIELIKQRDVRRLQVMERYCRTTGCLRNYILNYFGERTEGPCDNCGNCHREFTEIDMTEAARQVINCVYETRGRYGLSVVIGTLLGAKRARLKELGTIEYRSYGKLPNLSEAEIRMLIDQMILDGYLIQTEEEYSVLRMGDITPLRDEQTRVLIRIYEEKKEESKKKKKRRNTDALTGVGYDLFEYLRAFRLQVAREEAVPPYIVFNDKTLIDLCVKLPTDRDSMLSVTGVGEAKYEKYGERFINAIREFMAERPNAMTSMAVEAGEEAPAGEVPVKKSSKKEEYCLTPEKAEQFSYRDLLSLTEIGEELNRLADLTVMKKAVRVRIWEHLVGWGYTEEKMIDGRMMKVPTELGKQKGIVTVDRISQKGFHYSLLMYPPVIQNEIVNFYVREVQSKVQD